MKFLNLSLIAPLLVLNCANLVACDHARMHEKLDSYDDALRMRPGWDPSLVRYASASACTRPAVHTLRVCAALRPSLGRGLQGIRAYETWSSCLKDDEPYKIAETYTRCVLGSKSDSDLTRCRADLVASADASFGEFFTKFDHSRR